VSYSFKKQLEASVLSATLKKKKIFFRADGVSLSWSILKLKGFFVKLKKFEWLFLAKKYTKSSFINVLMLTDKQFKATSQH
jgi:hypothetical protein